MSSFKVLPNPEAVATEAAAYLFNRINNCVDKKGECHVVLPGGTTPARCLELLADMPLPWKHIHWYPGDERCYPAGHAERNDTMIINKLFSGRNHSILNFHPIPAELGPEQGAEQFAKRINATAGIDIVVLGMGEDGHTASLFPENPALTDSRSVVPVYNAPKAPKERISLSLATLKNAESCIVIATGANKREALLNIRNGQPLPVSMVDPDVWFVDKTAYGPDH
jgi:6-phosphogluconolactonase